MALERREYKGGAVDTTIVSGISGTDLTITLTSSTGWPSGGANGPFAVAVGVIDATTKRFVSNTEKIEVASRTGTTLTIANTGKRGVDNTTALSHAAGETIRHVHFSQDADEANRTMANTIGAVTTKGDLLAATGANTLTRKAVGTNDQVLVADSAQATGVKWAQLGAGSLAADSVGTSQIAANAVGASELADNAVDTAAIVDLNVTTGKLAAGAVTAAKITAGTITATELAADSVGSSEIAAGAIDDENLFSTGLSPIIVASANPGAVGAHRFWFNTTSTKLALLKRNAGDTDWEIVNALVGQEYTPTLTGITIGNGINQARYRHHGSTIIVDGFVKVGSTTTVNSRIGCGLPIAAKNLSALHADEFFFHGAGRSTDVASGNSYGGVGVVGVGTVTLDTTKLDFIVTAGGIGWDINIPFPWSTTDRFSWFCEYEPGTLADANYV